MKKTLLISMLALAFVGCDHTPEPKTSAANYEKDNTGRNVRDRSSESVTSGDQSESAADRTITQQIRKAIMDDAHLSTNAKNVKIITNNGVVVLRGPVATEQEREAIEVKAKGVAGVKRVENELEAK